MAEINAERINTININKGEGMNQNDPENMPGLPIVQMVCTHSDHPVDNLSAMIGMGNIYGSLHQDTADGMSYILQIISHDLKVIADNLNHGMKAISGKH